MYHACQPRGNNEIRGRDDDSSNAREILVVLIVLVYVFFIQVTSD